MCTSIFAIFCSVAEIGIKSRDFFDAYFVNIDYAFCQMILVTILTYVHTLVERILIMAVITLFVNVKQLRNTVYGQVIRHKTTT